ncbi:MAG: DUF4340 domain-containing protein [Oscillospiraceae bacterium]|nr:DUF4340 domain-containing protein [Oscillospiraceae bacterium]
MKKAKRTLTVLVAVLCLVVAALVAMSLINARNNRRAEEEKEAAIINLGNIGEADRLVLNCGKNGEDITFVLEDETWYAESMRGLTLDQNTVGHIAEEVSGLKAERKVEIKEDVSYYGLDEPRFHLTASDPEGHSISLLTGKSFDTVAGTKYYVMEPGGTEIYTVDSDLVKALDYSVYDMAKPDSFTVLTEDNIDSITVKDGKGTELYFEKKTEQADNGEFEYTWFLKTKDGLVQTSDVTLNPNNAGETTAKGYIDAILKNFTRCFFYKTCDFDRTDADLKSEFGFDGLTVEIADTAENDDGETVSEKITIVFGSDFTEEDDFTYAKFPDSGQVNCMTTRRVAPFREALADLAEVVR